MNRTNALPTAPATAALPRVAAAMCAFAALAALAGTARAADIDPMAKMPDRIQPHRLTLPDADRAKMVLRQQQALAEGAAVSDEQRKAAARAANQLAWDTITSQYANSNATLSAINLLYEVDLAANLGTALGDAGVILSLASWNIALNQDPDDKVANLALAKDCMFWALQRFGWAELQVSMGAAGLVDYALNELGKSSVRARRLIIESAFFNYHTYKGEPGYLSQKDWARKFFQAKVRTRQEAYKVIREHYSLFWKLGQEAIQRYADKRTVEFNAGPLDKTLIALGGGIGRVTYNDDDIRAVEDAYIADYALPAMKQYFEVELPRRIRQQAQARAAAKLAAVIERANRTSTVTVRLLNADKVPGEKVVAIGPWRVRPTDTGSAELTFTHYAWALGREGEGGRPMVLVGVRGGNSQPRIYQQAMADPLKQDRQEVIIDLSAGVPVLVTVKDAADGHGLGGALVAIRGPAGQRGVRTNGSGQADLGYWPEGEYEVGARADGYDDQVVTRTVPSKGTLLISLSLKKPESPPDLPGLPEDKPDTASTPPDDGPPEVAVDVPADPSGSNSQQRAWWRNWRDAKIRELQQKLATDPNREANKRACLAQGGQAREMACAKCGWSGKHYWIETSWSCPKCEYCTVPQDLDRGGGMTYRQYAQAIITRYNQAMDRVRTIADEKIEALQ